MKKRAKGEGAITQRRDGRWEGRLSFGFRNNEVANGIGSDNSALNGAGAGHNAANGTGSDPDAANGTGSDRDAASYTGSDRKTILLQNKRQRVRKVVYGKTRGEVVEKMRELEARYSPNADMLVKDHMDTWLSDVKSRCVPQTYLTYRAWVRNHIIPHLGERRVGALESKDVRAWLRMLEVKKDEKNKPVGAMTRKRALTTLRSALQQLVDDEVIYRNPCDGVRGPKVQQKLVEIPEPAAINDILQAADPFWLFTLVLVAFTSSLRMSEIFALLWSKLDLEDGTITVDAALGVDWDGQLVRRNTKTKASKRTLVLPEISVLALRKLKIEQQSAGYTGQWIFPDSDGGPLRKSNFARRNWAPLLKKAGLPHMVFHSTRHAGNALLIAQGETPLALKERMGHESIRMTLGTYGHLFAGASRRSAELMSDALGGAGIVPDSFGLSDTKR